MPRKWKERDYRTVRDMFIAGARLGVGPNRVLTPGAIAWAKERYRSNIKQNLRRGRFDDAGVADAVICAYRTGQLAATYAGASTLVTKSDFRRACKKMEGLVKVLARRRTGGDDIGTLGLVCM